MRPTSVWAALLKQPADPGEIEELKGDGILAYRCTDIGALRADLAALVSAGALAVQG